MSDLTYAVVQVQIVGDVNEWYHSYFTDGTLWPNRRAAIKHGIDSLDHDDFLLAHLSGDRLVMTSWQYEDRPDEAGERIDMANQCGWVADDEEDTDSEFSRDFASYVEGNKLPGDRW